MSTENLIETTIRRRRKNEKRTPGEHEKLYIWNSSQMMMWTNKRRTLVMRRWKGKFESEKRLHYYEISSEEEEGKHADAEKIKKTQDDHENQQKNDENDQALVSNEMTLSSIGNDIFIGDLASTSNMTNNKTGVYNLTPIRGSVMIGNGESISCTHMGKLDVICKHKDGSTARQTWEVKIVPQLNHDLLSFTKAMKEGWQMNGRWKEGGLMIELFKTVKTSMKFDRMIPSGSSWLMGIKT